MNFSFIVPEKFLYLSESSQIHRFFFGLWDSSNLYRDFCQSQRDQGKRIILSPGFSSIEIVPIDAISLLKPDVVEIPVGKISEMEWWVQTIKEVSPSSEIMITLETGNSQDALKSYFLIPESSLLENSITWIGLHRFMETIAHGNTGGRSLFLNMYGDLLAGRKIWLCGIYRKPVEEIISIMSAAEQKSLEIVGADSSKLWRICSTGRAYSEYSPYPNPFNFRQQNVSEEVLMFIKSQFTEYQKLWLHSNSTESSSV